MWRGSGLRSPGRRPGGGGAPVGPGAAAGRRPGNSTDRSSNVLAPWISATRPDEAAFRAEVRAWLADHLTGEFAGLGSAGGPADEAGWDVRIEWEKLLGRDRWVGLSWPARIRRPRRRRRAADHLQRGVREGERAGADLVLRRGAVRTHADPVRHRRAEAPVPPADPSGRRAVVPGLLGAERRLATSRTSRPRAVLDGDEWVITGQKVWTTLAHRADWCFVVCRTDPESTSHHGLSYLLVPMHQPGDRGAAAAPDDGQLPSSTKCSSTARAPRRRTCSARSVRAGRSRWRRSASSAGPRSCRQQLAFERELAHLLDVAHKNGAAEDAVIRDELARSYAGLQVMKYNGLRMLTGLVHRASLGPEASIGKLFWTTWHRQFGEVAMDVLGADGWRSRRTPTARTSSTSSTRSSWRAARRRSTPARARSNATSSASGCSDSRGNRNHR